jgi:hypothetical protein
MKTASLLIRLILFFISVFIIGYIFKTMHWPGRYFILIFGGVGFSFSLIILSFTFDFKKIENIIINKSKEIDNVDL